MNLGPTTNEDPDVSAKNADEAKRQREQADALRSYLKMASYLADATGRPFAVVYAKDAPGFTNVDVDLERIDGRKVLGVATPSPNWRWVYWETILSLFLGALFVKVLSWAW